MADAVLAALAAVPPLEWLAVVLALGYLLLAIRQDAWCWAFAIASALLYCVVFARAGLRMQAALQVFFVAMAIYGWRQWRGTAVAPPRPVGRWPWRRHVAGLAAIALLTAASVAWLPRTTATWVGAADAATAWASVFTTWLVARKVLENWLWWIVIDLVAVVLYATQGLHATAALYLLYAGLAVRGYVAWRDDLRGHVRG